MFIDYPKGYNPSALRSKRLDALDNALREYREENGEKIHHAVVKALANRYRLNYASGKVRAKRLGLAIV